MSSEALLAEVSDLILPVIPEKYRGQAKTHLYEYLEKNSDVETRKEFLECFQVCGETWGFQRGHRLAKKMLEWLMMTMFSNQGTLEGIEFLKQAKELAKGEHNVVMISNHLSYGDVNYLNGLLSFKGLDPYPFLVMAGPKVYQDPFRRLSSMAFDTLRIAQPPSRASEGADVPPRELAKITRLALKDAEHWQANERILYFFPEGSRSRAGDLQRFIAASARYLELPKTIIFPIGYSGTENLMGVKSTDIEADNISIIAKEGVEIEKIKGLLPESSADRRKVLMDICGFAVAECLPEALRGIYRFEDAESDDEWLVQARKMYLTEIRDR